MNIIFTAFMTVLVLLAMLEMVVFGWWIIKDVFEL